MSHWLYFTCALNSVSKFSHLLWHWKLKVFINRKASSAVDCCCCYYISTRGVARIFSRGGEAPKKILNLPLSRTVLPPPRTLILTQPRIPILPPSKIRILPHWITIFLIYWAMCIDAILLSSFLEYLHPLSPNSSSFSLHYKISLNT